jgi:hypothetical protein
MNHPSGKAWTMERASVTVAGEGSPHSNKYSSNDSDQRPMAGTRERVWVGGYRRSDGTKVRGHYRSLLRR